MSKLEGMVNSIKKWGVQALVGLTVIGAAVDSVYIVGQRQEGVVTRLGRYTSTQGPGLHFKAPFIDGVNKVDVTKVNRLEIGFRSESNDGGGLFGSSDEGSTKVTNESLMLTGDENIVQSEFIVQYQIKDSRDYLFNIKDVEGTIKDVAESAHRAVVGDTSIDNVLTDGKTEVEYKTKERMQSILDGYKSGVRIVQVQLQDVYAPEKVRGAFEDVASAREDKITFINKAKGYQNERIPKARAEARQKIEDALGYQAERVNIAKGDVVQYNEVLKEYRRNPTITKDRLLIETMEEVLPHTEKYFLQDGTSTLNLLDLNKYTGDKQ